MTTDYNEKLAADYEKIHDKVKRGMLPLVARNPAIDKAVSEYVLAQTEYFEKKRSNSGSAPIQYRNSAMLDRFANLIMYEELKWSHPDKMSIVEYPVESESQETTRRAKRKPVDDIQYGDRRFTNYRKTYFTDDNGAPQVRKSRLVEVNDRDTDALIDRIDLYDALENAGLTERQREAIDLVYFGNMTQKEAAEEMRISKSNVNAYLAASLRKLREYLTE